MRRPRIAVTASLGVALATMVGVTGAVVCSGSGALAQGASGGLEQDTTASIEASREIGRQTRRKQQEQEFLKQHSDASGVPRPDLWRKGVAQQKQMKVAPYVGWHPSSDSEKKSLPTANK